MKAFNKDLLCESTKASLGTPRDQDIGCKGRNTGEPDKESSKPFLQAAQPKVLSGPR